MGASLSPQSAFLLLQGLETLHVRIERHFENAQIVAKYLLGHPEIEWVNFPGLEDHPSHGLAKKYFTNGYGSIITFGIKGGREAGSKLIDHIDLCCTVPNVGLQNSFFILLASIHYHQSLEADLAGGGLTDDWV